MAGKVRVNVSLDADVKKEAVSLFQSFGLDLSTAINLFLSQSVREGKIPFEIRDVKKARVVKAEEKETGSDEYLKFLND